MSQWAVLVSCEHGGNRVPRAYRALFASAAATRALASHRGFDPGALAVARTLARRLGVELLAHETTRLLVEPNRSLGHRRLFSEWSAVLTPEEQRAAIERHYLPHRQRVTDAVARCRARTVCHIAVHSFTPMLDSLRRSADLGLLYDPGRALERAFCARWVEVLTSLAPDLRVRRNYPYRGTSDGLTTALRREFAAGRYLGIELEVNQALLTGGTARARRIAATLATSVERLLG